MNKIKLLFVHDTPFVKEGNLVYCGDSLPQSVWINNYLPYFDTLSVIGRQGYKEKDGRVLSSIEGNRLNFNLITEYSSIKSYFLNYFKIRKRIKKDILKNDLTVVRLPSILGFIAFSILMKYDKPFYIEIVGNAKEALWNHGSITGKLCAHYFNRLTKKCTLQASHVLYVVKKLKVEYPTNGYSEIISDVIISQIIHSENLQLSRFNSKIIKIGLIGGFATRYKGQEILLKAISKLDSNTKKNIELYFFGTGNSDWLVNLAKKLNLETNIKYLGTIPHNKLLDILKTLSLYIQPSYTEGMPRGMLEAMSVGCPVLGSEVGGIPDVIVPELLHTPRDYNKLSEQIKKFYDHRELLIEQSYLNLKRVTSFSKSILDEKRSIFLNKLISEMSEIHLKMKSKLIKVTTIPFSLKILLDGQLSYLNNYYDVIAISSKSQELYEIEYNEKIKTIGVNISRKISILNDLVSLFKLYMILYKERPSIVHSITPKAGLLSMVASKLAGVPIRMHTFTGLIFPSKEGIFQKI